MSLVFLMGMPGSGKSYWMQHLASFYNCTGLDLDDEIEKYSGKTITQLFDKGETYFRQAENIMLYGVINKGYANAIIATGGGAPCFYNNVDIMNKHGISIYLRAPVDLLINNILQSQDERPLLKDLNESDMSDKINNLLRERERFYNQATITVNTEQISLATFARILQPYISK